MNSGKKTGVSVGIPGRWGGDLPWDSEKEGHMKLRKGNQPCGTQRTE